MTHIIAHGNTAVQAARIIAAAQDDRRKRAEAYYLAAKWHDKQAAACKAMAEDSPRLDSAIRAQAAANAVHHGASAAGLRIAATGLLRRSLSEIYTQYPDSDAPHTTT